MRSPFRVIHDRPEKVTVRFDKKVPGYANEKIWHHAQRIEPQKDGSILFSAEVAGTDEVKAWVMSWGLQAEILAPQFLRREVVQELSDWVKAYTRLSRKAKPI